MTSTSENKSRQLITEFKAGEVRDFFMKGTSFCGFDLPPYFDFEPVLQGVGDILDKHKFSDITTDPRDHIGVNYELLSNKDGRLAWRPIQLIHPALYVHLVRDITEKESWKLIKQRFGLFGKNSKIQCLSIPVSSRTRYSDRAQQVLQWWQDIEQHSIRLSLDFEFMAHTDVTDCYGSIYTHSVAWALHDRSFAQQKKNQKDKSLLGNRIDSCLQNMQRGQTNGIAQGSVLMDFIAELILGYSDTILTERVDAAGIKDYRILRYRDDYRIFVNEPTVGERLLQLISETMHEFGMKLNAEKTGLTNSVVQAATKPDKRYWLSTKQAHRNVQKHLSLVHDLSQRHPNSGSLLRALTDFHRRVARLRRAVPDAEVLIAMVVDIAVHNPKVYPVAAAIISSLILMIPPTSERKRLLHRIVSRFRRVPNTGHLQIWLQRISMFHEKKIEFLEPLCRLIAGENVTIWNNDWISNGKLKKLLAPNKVISTSEMDKLKSTIDASEFELFYYDSL